MPRNPKAETVGGGDGERSGQLRPGRVRQIPYFVSAHYRECPEPSAPCAHGSRSTSEDRREERGTPSIRCPSPRTSAFQRRAIVNVRYSASRTPGGWKAHGTYIERESARAIERIRTQRDLDWRRSSLLARSPTAGKRPATGVYSKSFSRRRTRARTLSEQPRKSSLGSRTKFRKGRMGRSGPPQHGPSSRPHHCPRPAPFRGGVHSSARSDPAWTERGSARILNPAARSTHHRGDRSSKSRRS